MSGVGFTSEDQRNLNRVAAAAERLGFTKVHEAVMVEEVWAGVPVVSCPIYLPDFAEAGGTMDGLFGQITIGFMRDGGMPDAVEAAMTEGADRDDWDYPWLEPLADALEAQVIA